MKTFISGIVVTDGSFDEKHFLNDRFSGDDHFRDPFIRLLSIYPTDTKLINAHVGVYEPEGLVHYTNGYQRQLLTVAEFEKQFI